MKLTIHFKKSVIDFVAHSEKTLIHYLDQLGVKAYIITGTKVLAY